MDNTSFADLTTMADAFEASFSNTAAALETDLARLQRSYNKDHQEVKRAKRKVEIFEAAVNDVLR